jgi:hypothetical protein
LVRKDRGDDQEEGSSGGGDDDEEADEALAMLLNKPGEGALGQSAKGVVKTEPVAVCESVLLHN